MTDNALATPFTKGQTALLEQLRKTIDSCKAAGIVFYATSGGGLFAMRRPAEEALLFAMEVEGVPYSVSQVSNQADAIGMAVWHKICIKDAGD